MPTRPSHLMDWVPKPTNTVPMGINFELFSLKVVNFNRRLCAAKGAGRSLVIARD